MFFRKGIVAFIGFALLSQVVAAQGLTASMGKVNLVFMLDLAGRPTYSVSYNQKIFIAPSVMGFKLTDDKAMDADFALLGSEKTSVDINWKPVWGEVSTIRNNYEQLTVHLK